MVRAVLTDVVIFDEHLYRPTGLVGFWMTKVTTRFGVEARIAAPLGTTGRLKAGITTSTRQVGPKLVQGLISSTAPHTLYVIHGTGYPVKGNEGRIWTTKGFITRNSEDAYISLWGVKNAEGKFSRTGKGTRKQYKIRKKGYWLKLPFPSRNGGQVMTFSVRGQDPNNFLITAWNRTAYTHSAIRRRGASLPSL